MSQYVPNYQNHSWKHDGLAGIASMLYYSDLIITCAAQQEKKSSVLSLKYAQNSTLELHTVSLISTCCGNSMFPSTSTSCLFNKTILLTKQYVD